MGRSPVCLTLASIALVAGCTSTHSHQAGAATVHGTVLLSGGPPPPPGRTAGQKGIGSVLFFTTANRTGTPAYTTSIQSDGTYSVLVTPGHYYLATTAADFNGSPAPGPSVVVHPGQDLKEDIGIPIK